MLGGLAMENTLTLEHVPPGCFPDWLLGHLREQVLDPTLPTLLVIHSSDAARAELLSRLEGAGIGPIDRSRHHTLESLRKSLHADLRLPRLLPSDAAGSRLLHAECEMGAREGYFPSLHASAEHRWGEGRTRALARLCQAFDVEDVRSWDGPGIDGFRKRLVRMGKAMNGVHPLISRRTLIDALGTSESMPFTLVGIAGIVLMDQLPTLSRSDRRLLLALLAWRSIHQLCQHGDAPIGNHRLGLHGAILEDVQPSVADWVPAHDVWTPEPLAQSVHRLLVPKGGLGIDASLEVLRDWVGSAPADASVLIIDPGASERAESWRRGLIEIGLRPARAAAPLKAAPAIHWLAETASIGLGPEAWSMERLRGLGSQRSLRFTEEWLQVEPHPEHADWVPEMDPDRLEGLARAWHILGGHGALERWLRALASPPRPAPWEDPAEAAMRAECTQWWLLCLISRLAPLLTPAERVLLEESNHRVGCASGAELPLPPMPSNCSAWLNEITAHIDWSEMLTDAGALQRLFEAHGSLRRARGVLSPRNASTGRGWVEELVGLIEDMQAPPVTEAGDRVRILSPEEALGTSADLILLTHLTNTGWNLRAERLPWLDEEERTRLDLSRPDAPLRAARHALHHLLHASEDILLIDATGLDDDVQPAAPLAEWLAEREGADSADGVEPPPFLVGWDTAASDRTRGHHLSWRPARIEMVVEAGHARAEVHLSGRSVRDDRQRAGLALRDARTPGSPPLRPESVSIPLDAALMQDRLRRQPTTGPLTMDLHDRFVGVADLRIVPTGSGAAGEVKPREAPSWPVLGGKVGRTHLLANDPRPLAPRATHLPVYDDRQGCTEEATSPRPRWSASRLQRWQACPRQGWLDRRLGASRAETQEEDLDARIRGDLIHGALGAVFEQALELPDGHVRSVEGATSLANLGEAREVLFAHILDHLGRRAPWLEREDATAAQRRHDLIGLDRETWLAWLASPRPMTPTGRLGKLLLAELELHNAIPISMEWALDGIEIPHPDGRSISMTGFIDRVDVVQLPGYGGQQTAVAPLDWSQESDWIPCRLILIRDIKSVDGPKREAIGARHRKALFDELQLGLYARAWEIAHPGDLVIGAGISEVGADTVHSLEVSAVFAAALAEHGVGDLTDFIQSTHRLPSEGPEPASDPFRAWMQERLTTALDIAEAADAGRVHATPSEGVCTWCRVKEACGLAPIVGGDRSWS